MFMVQRTGSSDARSHQQWLRTLFAALMVGIAARTGFAQEAGPVPESKALPRISVARIESSERSDAAGPSDSATRSPPEARVGDRIAIRLIDVADDEFKDKNVAVRFTNRETHHDVGWAKWRQEKDGSFDHTVLEVSVPQRVLPDPDKPEWVAIEVWFDGRAASGRAGLHVYPRTHVVLETINGRSTDSDPPAAIEWTHQIRVSGSGFVVPDRHIEFMVDRVRFPVQDVDPEGRSFVVQLPKKYRDAGASDERLAHIGRKQLSLMVWDDEVDLGGFDTVQVEDGTQLTLARKWAAVGVSLLPMALLAALLALACRRVQLNRIYAGRKDVGSAVVTSGDPSRGGAKKRRSRFGSFEILLLDPATNTYSLSRFQFVWWLGIVLFSYSYLFFARGCYVARDWCFYDLSGSAYPLLISLGTLIGATWTTKLVGSKGGGDVHPALTDLVVHGGVISLDRVQQLAISVIAGVMFVWIVWTTAPTTASLPDVPEKILTLMGFSAAGYLGGKFARKPGPIVDHADVVDAAPSAETGKSGSGTAGAKSDLTGKVLRIWGVNFAAGAEVFVNQKRVDPEAIVPEERSDGAPGFSNVLKIELSKLPSEIRGTKLTSVVVVNGDAQEARWADSDDEEDCSI